MANQKEIFVNVYRCGNGFEVGHVAHDSAEKAYAAHIGDSTYLYTAKLVPVEIEPSIFTPKHDDICTVLTKQGLATKCKVYEHEGELYAIALKDDKPDGTFNPSQIEKFLPL